MSTGRAATEREGTSLDRNRDGDAPSGPRGEDQDADVLGRLRAGDESAFAELVDRYHASMVRIAGLYVRDRAVAEEVAQEAWVGALNGIDRFEGRSTLKTWLFRILTNTAKTRGRREARTIPFSALSEGSEEPAVDPDRFTSAPVGAWAAQPVRWWEGPESRALGDEARDLVLREIDKLPETQRAVITLRDVQGFDGPEVAEMLGVTDGNQRVLLHRARQRVRRALEDYFGDT